jgi:hypothetical protein
MSRTAVKTQTLRKVDLSEGDKENRPKAFNCFSQLELILEALHKRRGEFLTSNKELQEALSKKDLQSVGNVVSSWKTKTTEFIWSSVRVLAQPKWSQSTAEFVLGQISEHDGPRRDNFSPHWEKLNTDHLTFVDVMKSVVLIFLWSYIDKSCLTSIQRILRLGLRTGQEKLFCRPAPKQEGKTFGIHAWWWLSCFTMCVKESSSIASHRCVPHSWDDGQMGLFSILEVFFIPGSILGTYKHFLWLGVNPAGDIPKLLITSQFPPELVGHISQNENKVLRITAAFFHYLYVQWPKASEPSASLGWDVTDIMTLLDEQNWTEVIPQGYHFNNFMNFFAHSSEGKLVLALPPSAGLQSLIVFMLPITKCLEETPDMNVAEFEQVLESFVTEQFHFKEGVTMLARATGFIYLFTWHLTANVIDSSDPLWTLRDKLVSLVDGLDNPIKPGPSDWSRICSLIMPNKNDDVLSFYVSKCVAQRKIKPPMGKEMQYFVELSRAQEMDVIVDNENTSETSNPKGTRSEKSKGKHHDKKRKEKPSSTSATKPLKKEKKQKQKKSETNGDEEQLSSERSSKRSSSNKKTPTSKKKKERKQKHSPSSKDDNKIDQPEATNENNNITFTVENNADENGAKLGDENVAILNDDSFSETAQKRSNIIVTDKPLSPLQILKSRGLKKTVQSSAEIESPEKPHGAENSNMLRTLRSQNSPAGKK